MKPDLTLVAILLVSFQIFMAYQQHRHMGIEIRQLIERTACACECKGSH